MLVWGALLFPFEHLRLIGKARGHGTVDNEVIVFGDEIDDTAEREVRTYYNLGEARSTQMPRAKAAGTSQAQAGRTQGRDTQEAATVKLHEEQLKIGKRKVEAGGIRLRKIIRTETVNQPVELQREEIVVERVPAGQQTQRGTGDSYNQDEIFIPLRREEAVVQKESTVREEVRVSKKTQTERQNVSEQVRKEDIDIQRSGTGSTNMATGATTNVTPGTGANSGRATQPAGRRKTTAKSSGKKAVFCLCRDESQASRIVDDLKQAGFSNNDISVLLADKSGTRDFAHEKNTKAPEGAATGAGTGGVLGGILGWLTGVGALAIPGVGPFIAAGPIMATLGGAAIGAAAGGLTGALIGLGIPEYEAKRYEGKLKEGNILVSVHSDNGDETRRAKEIFARAGADDISATGEEKVSAHAE